MTFLMDSTSVFFNRLPKYKFSEMLCSSTSEEQLKQNRIIHPFTIKLALTLCLRSLNVRLNYNLTKSAAL